MTARNLFSRLVAAGIVLVAAAAAAFADDESQAARFFRRRLATVEKEAAARLWDAADRARRVRLFAYARQEADRVLELDTDHRAARLFLGYVKKPEGWTVDTDVRSKLPTENLEPPSGTKLDLEIAWRAGAAAKADLDVAALFAAFGDECVSKGATAEAVTMYGRALKLDRDNRVAHLGLHHFRMSDGLWLTHDGERELNVATPVRRIEEASRYDEMFGQKMVKGESGHFHVESAQPESALDGYLAACERTYAAYLADLGLDPATKVFPRMPTFCVLGTDAHWEQWVNRLVQPANQRFWRALTCHWARDRWACALRNHEGATDEKRRDRLSHQTVHMMNSAIWSMADGCWLDDALAYRYPVLLNDTTYAFCLVPHKSDYGKSGDGTRDWTNQEQWRLLLKEVVTTGEDPALRLIVNRSAYELPIMASVKGWSVVDFLLRRDRAAFVAMLGELKAAKDGVVLLETTFGKDVEALDSEWRRWVLETY